MHIQMSSYLQVQPFIGYFSAFHPEVTVLYKESMGIQQKMYCFDFIMVWILLLKKKKKGIWMGQKKNIKI